MMYKHPVYIKKYRGKFNNVDPYEHKSSIFDATKDIKNMDGIVRTSTLVNGFWIGDNVMHYFGLWLNSGRQFVEDVFILKADALISVILGANYEEKYAVGDELFVCSVFSEWPAQVVVFLEDGINVYYC